MLSNCNYDPLQLKFKKLIREISICLLISLISACGGSSGGDANSDGTNNTAPLANAGPDQSVSVGDSVTLNGSGSSDADGDNITFNWSILSSPAGSQAVLSAGSGAAPTFVADVAGSYQIRLTVNDGTSDSAADNVLVTASQSNQAPVADAGSDINATVGDSVSLDGSGSSDPDGNSLSYSWNIVSQPSGSSVTLSNNSSEMPTFTPSVVGAYEFSLTVNDGQVDSAADVVRVAVAASGVNVPPVANAGLDQSVTTGDIVSLSASGSSDANGDMLTYVWTVDSSPANSSAVLSNANAEEPTFTADRNGDYIFSLVVNDGMADSNADTVTVTASSSVWLLNNTERSTFIVNGGTGALVNVQSVDNVSVGNTDFVQVSATGVPDYVVTADQSLIDQLNNRPRAMNDFVSGQTTVLIGDDIEFGEDIGYRQNPGCNLGYWPPGPECPSDQAKQDNIPADPTPASSQECETSIGAIGLMLNGTSIYNWGDDQSFNNGGVWQNLAPVFEQYDVDICLGHAQQAGDYHHHMFSKCLMELLGDDGTEHSPIYGYAADGYPVYGPYYANGVLAVSAWVKRDYDDINSATGCGVAGERSCLMVDQRDPSQGTTPAASNGPSTNDSASTLSGNSIDADSGIYLQDYYFDSTLAAQGGEHLDEHNGHDHGGLNYHYHITVTAENDGSLTPAFPYNIGPTFYGTVPNGSLARCL